MRKRCQVLAHVRFGVVLCKMHPHLFPPVALNHPTITSALNAPFIPNHYTASARIYYVQDGGFARSGPL